MLLLFAAGCASTGDTRDAAPTVRAPLTLVLDDTREASSPEAQAASEASVTAARNAASRLTGGSSVGLAVQDGRIQPEGPDELELGRDTLGHVRRAALTTYIYDAQGVRTHRTYTNHWFDASGQTVGVGHVHQITLPPTCRREVASWFTDVWLDVRGDIVSVEPRLPPRPDPDASCAPPRAAGMTVAIYPDVASLLDAVGVADVDALPWETAPVRPPRGVPPPR